MAPRGFGGIIHVMEFKRDRPGINDGIGSTDAAQLARCPGLLFDNTQDHIIWGIWAARDKYPDDFSSLGGEDLVDLAARLTREWHPNFRRLIALTDPTTALPIRIRTSVPVEPWPSGKVTLLGDAIHTMTPGRGVGANTAIRDAALLARRLREARDGRKTVKEALSEYEGEMRRYSEEAVRESRKQMDGNALIHRPVIGRVQLAAVRTMMRIVNRVPALKRRMIAAQTRLRKTEDLKAK
jgi:2-polyprenyl-6-methoxyphenol hydroxylase-like FAD-dependent oxidoreductase